VVPDPPFQHHNRKATSDRPSAIRTPTSFSRNQCGGSIVGTIDVDRRDGVPGDQPTAELPVDDTVRGQQNMGGAKEVPVEKAGGGDARAADGLYSREADENPVTAVVIPSPGDDLRYGNGGKPDTGDDLKPRDDGVPRQVFRTHSDVIASHSDPIRSEEARPCIQGSGHRSSARSHVREVKEISVVRDVAVGL
jgi:hypothetical protein